jgi:hypothetical protein
MAKLVSLARAEGSGVVVTRFGGGFRLDLPPYTRGRDAAVAVWLSNEEASAAIYLIRKLFGTPGVEHG